MKSLFPAKKQELILLGGLSLLLIVVFVSFSFISPGCEGGMDSYNHYLISRYSWKYPYLFLDQWGKPLYTILASPFAQFGFHGVEIFNILLWVGTAWITWLAAHKAGIKYAWIAFILVLLPQVSMENVISGLTEYLNAFLLGLTLLFAAGRKWNLTALMAGLLPFSRSEGFIIMAVFGFYLVFIERQYKSLWWFFAGPVIFNTLGWMIEGDPFWIITHNPYIKVESLGINLCGSGSFFSYALASKYIFSLAGTVLVGLAILLAMVGFFMPSVRQERSFHFVFWLCLGTFLSYFLVHSIIWWKGMMGSCGYNRVMIVISPVMAIAGAWITGWLSDWSGTFKKLPLLLVAGLLLVSAWQSWQHFRWIMPLKISKEQEEFTRVAQWLNTFDHSGNMKYFLYPYLNIQADIDPYDRKHFDFLWGFDKSYAPDGCIVIWDSHFGPNESKLPLESLQKDSSFYLMRSFIPDTPFVTVNNAPFEIHVFKKGKP